SRRRHTRFSRDWSSDVCSSDLAVQAGKVYEFDVEIFPTLATLARGHSLRLAIQTADEPHSNGNAPQSVNSAGGALTVYAGSAHRSEERRVGKEGRSGW